MPGLLNRRPAGALRRARRTAVVTTVALVGAMAPAVVMATASPAGAATFVQGAFVSPTLEGCKGTAGVSFPLAGPFVCPDSEYTSGNLGKGWNELDLVPHRLTTSLGSQSGATTSYSLILAGDNSETAGGLPEGYDFISAPAVNSDDSDGSCAITVGDMQERGGITGGIYDGKYRQVEITQAKGTTCVFDYYMRLSITAADFSGSSLQGYMFEGANFSTGKRTVPIPVQDVLPQDFTNGGTVTQDSRHAWNIVKTQGPVPLAFGDTCAPGASLSRTHSITVTWTKLAATAEGEARVLANVYAINTAHRPITVSVTNTLLVGGLAISPLGGSTDTNPKTGSATVNPGTHLLFTQDILVPAGSVVTSSGVASYSDPVPPYPAINGTNTKSTLLSSVAGTTTGASAVIDDVETIAGTGFSYKVDSVTGSGSAGGTLTNTADDTPYVLGTATSGQVTWTSSSRNPTAGSSESVTFNKTVTLDQPRITSGTLSDVARVLDGATVVASDSLSAALTATAGVTLRIDKTISVVLGSNDGTQTFTFDVTGPNGYSVERTISFGAGEGGTTEAGVKSVSLTDLAPGTYVVAERTLAPWAPQLARNVTITLPTCSSSTRIDNGFGPATAQVRKVTAPAGEEAGWTFDLKQGEDILDTQVTTGSGYVAFDAVLEDGSYTVVERARSGWDQSAETAECAFTVNLPADADRTFSCTVTNTKRATVTVDKTVTRGSDVTDGAGYTFEVRSGASRQAVGTVVVSDTTDATGDADFNGTLAPGSYALCETNLLPGWTTSLSAMTGSFVPGSEDALGNPLPGDAYSNDVVCIPLVLTAGQNAVVQVDNRPPPDGRAHTIGFWKNHSSCTKGGQEHVLDQTLALFAGGGLYVGDLFVNTCEEAYAILNKSSIAGKKLAGDAAYGLASQLLAAQLNVQAGAGSCPQADTARAAGQALLDGIGFVAAGDYLGSKVKGAAATTRNTATTLAGTLDSYNNNTLCG